MKKIISIIASIIALTVTGLGHAEEVQVDQTMPRASFIDQVVTGTRDRLDSLVQTLSTPIIDFKFTEKDVDCLARNIFYEAANEPEEGKVAVGLVTINRVRDGRFGKSICSVVDQRRVFVRTREVERTETVQRGNFGKPEARTVKQVVIDSINVCQFSWRCVFVRAPKPTDERWQESRAIAERLMAGEYDQYHGKYENALYFHATGLRPVWAGSMNYIARIGGHIFYRERT